MKKYISNNLSGTLLLLILFGLFSGILFQSCEDDDETTGPNAVPLIKYVRLTDPEKSDSLVTHAFMGNTVALMGENLGAVTEVWFNDQSALLNTSFITNNCIIVTIPNEIPDVVTDEIKLITKGNVEATYGFGVDVPPPFVSSMLCEHVKDGGTAVINGNFFIDDPNKPLQVFFPGNIEGEVLSVELTKIEVKVPQGVGVGPVQVKSIYGSSRSSFYFRDDRNYILDFDQLTSSGSWRSGTILNDEQSLYGNYLVLRGEMGDNAGAEDYSGGGFVCELWGDANGRPEGNFVEGNPADYQIKFEAKVIEWSGAYLNICFGPWASSVAPYQNQLYWGNINARALWRPWETSGTGSFKTEDWITVTIPMTNVKYNNEFDAMEFDPELAGSMSLWMKGPAAESGGTCKMEIYIDNVRIVPL
ncbi:MAG: glycan-binding surface protein [Draconibacterium sp.]